MPELPRPPGPARARAVDRWKHLSGLSGNNTFTAGALLACTAVSIGGIGVGAGRLRAIKRSGRVAWTGGLGLRF